MSQMSPKPKAELARQHLETARGHVEDNAEGDAVNALFYAAEAAVDGLTEVHGIDTRKLHYLKASAATELHERGVLEEDLAPLLRQLNQARKDIWYEGDDPDFGGRSLEDVFAEVEKLVEAGERSS